MAYIFYRSKEERVAELEQKLEKEIKFYNSGNCTDLEWQKASIILLLDNIEWEKNPVGVIESSSNKVREIIESGRINNYEITKDGEVIEYEPEIPFIDIEEIEIQHESCALDDFLATSTLAQNKQAVGEFMNIVKEWQYRLQQVNQTISDYREILVNNELTHDMKIFCLGEIERKTKYKNLIEETLRRLEG